jgi:hypothetical protein
VVGEGLCFFWPFSQKIRRGVQEARLEVPGGDAGKRYRLDGGFMAES